MMKKIGMGVGVLSERTKTILFSSQRQFGILSDILYNGQRQEKRKTSLKKQESSVNAVQRILWLGAFFFVCSSSFLNAADGHRAVDTGDTFYNGGQYDKAIKEYSKAISMDPALADAYYHRGLSYYRTGQYDEAIEDYTKALSLYPPPHDAELYQNRGLAYLKRGLYDKAIEDYTKAISINPQLPESYHNRGIAYSRQGLYDEAIEDYNKAISIRPGYGEAYFSRAMAFVRKASADFKRLCDMGNKNACENLKQLSE